MPLEARAENAMSGIVLLDLFTMMSQKECAKRGLPRGSLFVAPETSKNLQHAAMGIISVTLSKTADGCPWASGDQRLSELSIEQHVGRLRTQSTSAQLTARSYWTASARDMLRSHKRRKPAMLSRPPPESDGHLKPDEFYVASERAYRASLRLAGWCAGVTPESLHEAYTQWCKSKGFQQEVPLLGDEEEFQLDEEENTDGATSFLENIRAEAAMEAELPEDGPDDDALAFEDHLLAKLPEAQLLKELFAEKRADGSVEPEVPHESPKKGACSGESGMAKTLLHALWCLGSNASDAEVLDSIWRLTMYLRHWKKGCDRTWIADPRASRRKSKKLNWHQCLGMSGSGRDWEWLEIASRDTA